MSLKQLYGSLLLVATLSVVAVDVGVFARIRHDPARITIPFLVLVILVTLLPIALDGWVWLWVMKRGQ